MSRAPVLYQETRLAPSPASPFETLHINTSTEQGSSAGRKRAFDEISGLDEDSYARKCLATEGSVFFRHKSRAPRSVLWRVLDDRKVLEVQCVDLMHDARNSKGESRLTFRLQLPGEIARNGVGLADPQEHDALEVFVLTAESHELYTFTLKRDLLTRDTLPNEFDATTCFKKYVSHSLAFRHPYRLVAISSLELLISLHDGGLMRLVRQPHESGAQWRETFFSEGNWGDTLRGMITFRSHHTVRYGNTNLEPNAITAVAKSPDGKYLWTVTLEHELKAWSMQTGKVVMGMDLLNETRQEDGKKHPKHVMFAESGRLLQIVTPSISPGGQAVARINDDGPYVIVIHSPKEHQFKFYVVSSRNVDGEDHDMSIEDLQPTVKLIPRMGELMDTSIWHLEDFYCLLPSSDLQNTQLWVRARGGTLSRTFTLSFSLADKEGDSVDITSSWQRGWIEVDAGMQTAEALRAYSDFPGDYESGASSTMATPNEKWLDFLFYPGRFSTSSIETALHTYRKGRGLSVSPRTNRLNSSELPLKERLTQTIASKIILKRVANEQPDYDQYQSDIQVQWRTLYTLLSHLHSRRHDSIGFAVDAEEKLAWSVCADFVAPIRTSSHFEIMNANEHVLLDDELKQHGREMEYQVFTTEEAVYTGLVLALVKGFSVRLSPEFRARFRDQVLIEATRHEIGDNEQTEKLIQNLYSSLAFDSEVMDDDFQALESSAAELGGLGQLSESVILGVLEHMAADGHRRGSAADKSLSRYGEKLTIAVAQETLERDHSALVGLLMLVVFMYGDLDQADLHKEFVSEIGPIYDALVVRIKHNEMLSWLARKMITEGQKHHRSSKSSQVLDQDVTTVTLLERIFIGDWSPKSARQATLAENLTTWSKQWVHGPNLFDEWDGATGHVLAVLIKEQWFDLAAEFQMFLSQGEDSSSWLRYLEGRLCIATGDYAQAGLKFKAAADGMAEATKIAGTDTALLLDAEERNHFGAGQSRFYQHISSLFEKLKIFSYAADFASLALDHLEEDNSDFARSMAEIDRKKSAMDSPTMTKFDIASQERGLLKGFLERKHEILNRLFNALVQTGRFKEAFAALVEIKDMAMARSNLAILIKSCVDKEAVPTLLELAFEEGGLAQEADKILSEQAKKALSQPSSASVPYYQILYAFRTQRANYRGAAEILYDYLERLRSTQSKLGMLDPEDETLIQAYVLLINTLVCCGEEDAWLLADPIEEVHGGGRKRKLVTIADVRREYVAELDKRSDILQGRFPLLGDGEPMDVL